MSSLAPISSSSSSLVVPQVRVGGRFEIKHKIGCGAFGDVFLAFDTMNGKDVALKREKLTSRPTQVHSEYRLYGYLQGGVGVPGVLWYGAENGFNWMAMDLLGPSIEEMFNRCGRVFTIKTVLMLADGMLHRIEYLHSMQCIHRDIKPENFVMGIGPACDTIYLIDLGLARRFTDPRTGQHIPYREGTPFCGTGRYASVFTHRGIEQSRRDDLEQLAYALIYLLKGSLPWQKMKGETRKQKYEKIRDMKLSIPLQTLCQGCPDEFVEYLNYCQNLKFDEAPNYNFVRDMFRTVLHKLNHQFDFEFDWKTRNNGNQQRHPYQALPLP